RRLCDAAKNLGISIPKRRHARPLKCPPTLALISKLNCHEDTFMDTQPAHTQSLSRAYSPSRNARPDVSATQTINAALMALWASENAGVYTARAMKSLVVRHGAQPLSAEEFGHLT